MASRWWVGGTGTWDSSSTTHWAASSGGASGASVPIATDDVFIDANSGTGTVTVTSVVAQSIDCTGYTGTLALAASAFPAIGRSLKLVPGMTFTASGSAGVTFVTNDGNSGVGYSVTLSGNTLPSVTFNGTGSSKWVFADAVVVTNTITLSAGVLDTNSQSVTSSKFISTSGLTRNVTLGSTSWTLTNIGGGNGWDVGTGTTGYTVSAGTSTISMGTASFADNATGTNYATVIIAPTTNSSQNIGGIHTFTNLTLTGGAFKSVGFVFFGNQTVTGTFTVTGNSATNRVMVQSSTIGTARTLTVNTTVAATNADFQDIAAAGTASWNLSAISGGSGDALGNTGITFTTAATQFWVSGTGNWSDSTKWKTTSGGAVAGRVPLPQDSVVFDANSFTAGSQTVTADMARIGKDVTFTGVTNAPTWAITVATAMFGSLTWATGVLRGSWVSGLVIQGRSTHTLTFAGQTNAGSYTVQAFGGTYTVQDAVVVANTNQISLVNGTLNANGQTVSVGLLQSVGTLTRALTMGSGAWSITGTSGVVWQTASSGFTLTVTGNTTSFTGTSGTPTVTTGGVSMPAVNFNGAGGSWTFNDSFTSANTVTVTAGTFSTNNQTITIGTFAATGAGTRTVTLGSSSITVTGTSGLATWNWNPSGGTSTLTAGTSTITISGAGAGLQSLSGTGYNNVVLSGSGSQNFNASSVVNLTRTGTAVKTDALTFNNPTTVSGTLTVTGNSVVNRLLMSGFTLGTAQTITAAAVSLTNVDVMDINGVGAAAPFTGTSLGDAGGNSGITFDASVQQTWSGNTTGNWSTAANWTSRVPLPQDDVVISGLTSGTITADMPRLGRSISFVGSTGGTFAGTIALSLYGNLTLVSTLSFTQTNGVTFGGRGAFSVTTAGRIITGSSVWAGAGGTYTLQDAWADNTQTFIVNNGTVNANGQTVTTGALSSSVTTTRALQMGSGAWTLTRTLAGNAWNTGTTTGLTLTPSTAVVSCTGAPGSTATVTVLTGGVTMPNFTVNGGANLTVQFSDSFTTAGTIKLAAAKLDTNNQTVVCSVFAPGASGVTATRTLTLGSSSITASATGGATPAWDAQSTTGLTLTPGTSTITLTGVGPNMNTGNSASVTYNNVVMQSITATAGLGFSGTSCTIASLTAVGAAVKTAILQFSSASTPTIGILTITGNSATNRLMVQSSAFGTQRTITLGATATTAITNTDFQDIAGSGGAAGAWNLSAIAGGSGDALGNTGITFTTAASQFWRGNGGNWSDVNHWASTSGGAAASGRVPLPQDTATFDVNSFSSTAQAVVMDMPRIGANFTTTGATNTPSFNSSSINVTLYGNLTLSGVTRGTWSNQWLFQGRGAQTITLGGFSIPSAGIQSFGGTYTLQDAWSASTQPITVSFGTFNANGQTVTISQFISTNSGSTRAVTLGSGTWSIAAASGTAIAWSTTSSGLTLTVASSLVQFTGTSGTPTITTGGVTMGPLTFNGAGGTWTLQDSLTMGASSGITFTAGTLNTNSQSITALSFTIQSGTKTLTMGSSSWSLSANGGANTWNLVSGIGLTVTANTATVTQTSTSGSVQLGTVNWNGMSLVLSLTTASVTLNSTGATLANLTVTATGKSGFVSLNSTPLTITGTLTATGNSAVNRVAFFSSAPGTARTITAAVVSLTNVDFMDIAGAGAAAPFTGTSLGDALGNSGITFDAPTTQTHTASTGGNWSDVTKWTSRVPLPQDTVIVDVNTTGTLTTDMPRLGKDVTFTGFTGTLSFSSTPNSVYGSLTFGSGMTVSGTQSLNFSGRGSHTITSAGKSFTSNFLSMVGPGGSYTQQDSFSHTGTGSNAIQNGGWDANNQAYTGAIVNSNSGATRFVTMGSGTWTLTGSGSVWNFSTGALTVNAGTSTITFSASNVARTFAGGGFTYANFAYTVASPSQGTLTITGANTFASISVGDSRTLTLPSGSTTTITGSLSVAGTANVGYLYLGAQSGQYVSSPSQASNSITGDIDLRGEVAVDSLSSVLQTVVAKRGLNTSNIGYQLRINNGFVELVWSPDGTTANSASSTASLGSVGAISGGQVAVRATLSVASPYQVLFYYSFDHGASWTALGAAVNGVAGTSIFASTGAVEVGTVAAGTLQPLTGKVYWAEVRSGIAGTVVARFDASLFANPWRYYSPTANLLDKDTSDVEGSLGQLYIDTSGGSATGTIVRVAGAGVGGSAAAQATVSTVGTGAIFVAFYAGGTAGLPCVPGQVIGAVVTMKATAGRTLGMSANFFDASGTYISTLSMMGGVAATGVLQSFSGQCTAPANAVFCYARVQQSAAVIGDVFTVDQVGMFYGLPPAWSAGDVPWRINGYITNAGVPFGKTAINASTPNTAATLATPGGATVTNGSLKDITATPTNAVYALDSVNLGGNTGIVFAPDNVLPVSRKPIAKLQAVARGSNW